MPLLVGSLAWLSMVLWPAGLTATWPHVALFQATAFLAAVVFLFAGGLLRSLLRGLLFALVAVLLIVLIPRVPTPFLSDASPASHRILALNTYFGRADDSAIVARIEELNPDVVVLAETNPDEVTAVASGTGMAVSGPGGTGSAGDNAASVRPGLSGAEGTAILVRAGRGYEDTGDLNMTQFQNPSIELAGAVDSADSAKKPLRVVGVHPLTPVGEDRVHWDRSLADIGAWIDTFISDNAAESSESGSGSDSVPDSAQSQPGLVIAGDFNSTRSHPRFRDLNIDDCSGHLAQTPTWPAKFPVLRLDHILTTGDCHDGGTFRVNGTDHLGVWADVTP